MTRLTTMLLLLMCIATHQISAQTRYLNQVFNQVQVTPSVTYGVNATVLYQSLFGEAVPEALLMDIYRPVGDTATNRPVVLYFHTGNFGPFKNPDPTSPVQNGFNGACGGQRNDSAAVEICTRLAKMGYVAASCEYRLGWLPTATTQELRRYTLINAAYRGVQDARTAIRFMRRSVAEQSNVYGIDPNKIVLWGQGTGGYISLNTALLDDYAKIPTSTNGKFVWNPQATTGNPCAPNSIIPMIIPQVNGDINGTSVGQSPITDPLNACAVVKIDTLCYPYWPGYSSDFNPSVNMGGALADTGWVDPAATNPQPAMISFHVPNDNFAPYTTGTLSVPGQDPPLQVVEVQGSYMVQGFMQAAGQQTSLVNAPDYLDLADAQAAAFANSPAGLKDPRAGLYPLNMPPDPNNPALPTTTAPWEWTSFPGLPPIPGVTPGFSCNTNKAAAIVYIDTIVRFYAPRACFALGLQGCVDKILSNKEPLANNIHLTAVPNPAS
ncbi:MAG TPA: alpha/beta hydrolase, partial [Saprospiraceae bacterium]|nr:alpha/beta hydrolase [Saprospiraceae bacterium]